MKRFPCKILMALASAALAGATTPPDPQFAPIGGSYGQTARILVSAIPPDPCSVAVGFRTGEASPPDPDRTFNLAPGQTAAYDLNLNRLTGRFGVRIELRPRVVILAGRCSASVQVFEVFSGRTTAAMRLFTGAATPPDPSTNLIPPPDPQFAPLGAVSGQLVRLGVGRGEGFNTLPPDPCRGVLAFLDMQGNIVGPSRTVDLAPGQMAFLDFNPSSLSAATFASAARVTVRPHLFVPPPTNLADTLLGNIAGCQASAQVYETSTGWSMSAIPGNGAVSPPDPQFAPLGGSYGQTMRIMVSAFPPDPCSVAVGFRAGETSPPEPERTFNLAAGQSAFYDLDLGKLTGRFGVRIEVTPRVAILGGKCSASAEVFEVFSGRTTAHMNLFLGAIPPPDPSFNLASPPDPEFGALDAVSGQLVRLGVGRGEGINTAPPDPCRGTLTFVNALGASVGPSLAVDLLPGQRGFITLDPSRIGTFATNTSRVTVRPQLTTPPDPESVGSSLRGCQASVQVYESGTGWSTEAAGGR